MTSTDLPPEISDEKPNADTVEDVNARLIDNWFPCPEVDKAVRTPAGSGRSEKALFTWFASRPIAQARAAVLCSLLPDTENNRRDIKAAVLSGDRGSMDRLRKAITKQFGGKAPVVLDMFSGRGIIPLEASRAGANAIGTDLSPVASLAGRLLGDYPLRDWSAEPALPFNASLAATAEDEEDAEEAPPMLFDSAVTSEPRLLADVRLVLAEVGRRVADKVAAYYPGNPLRGGAIPWAYLWAVTIPCDGCKRRFPLIGSMVLRHPYKKTQDEGQAMKLVCKGDEWLVEVHAGTAQQMPTFASVGGKRGKSARCPFPNCGHVHTLDTVKAKGAAGQYLDAMLAVAETDEATQRKMFRVPRADETATAARLSRVPWDFGGGRV